MHKEKYWGGRYRAQLVYIKKIKKKQTKKTHYSQK